MDREGGAGSVASSTRLLLGLASPTHRAGRGRGCRLRTAPRLPRASIADEPAPVHRRVAVAKPSWCSGPRERTAIVDAVSRGHQRFWADSNNTIGATAKTVIT